MKKIIPLVTFIFLLITPFSMFSQQNERNLMNRELQQRPLSIQVYNSRNEKHVQERRLRSFQLKPNETKAVVEIGKQLLELDRQDVPQIQTIPSIRKIYMLPELYIAKIAGSNEQIKYQILILDSTPLRYDFDKGTFDGVLQFIPIEMNTAGTNPVQKELSSPEEIIIKYGAKSETIKLQYVNWPPIDFNVSTSTALDSFEVKVQTILKPLGYNQNMVVEPAIVLTTPREKIQGLGVQTIPVHVSLKGVTSYDPPVNITVASSRGNVENAHVILADGNPKEVRIRSENIGKFNLVVINSNFRSNSIEIESVFPWLFFVLSILGGLIGSLAKSLNKTGTVAVKALVIGSIYGLIIATAYWGLGINLSVIKFDINGINEIMVLALGLVAGYFGIKEP